MQQDVGHEESVLSLRRVCLSPGQQSPAAAPKMRTAGMVSSYRWKPSKVMLDAADTFASISDAKTQQPPSASSPARKPPMPANNSANVNSDEESSERTVRRLLCTSWHGMADSDSAAVAAAAAVTAVAALASALAEVVLAPAANALHQFEAFGTKFPERQYWSPKNMFPHLAIAVAAAAAA
eukprot:CAMPEP_0172936936 /NCGR_PEP_ID=MMETSP1075-20121228/222270_1 /TAXON_ID=2916 /ORGANISM="Ceratium fusus, Strain PA161109" /LENGTH=180 /DNA_ID=CAMNT_0013798309 /DNA_START=528 /DNA_END=1069 /DNA_ORIENTATION=-